MWPLNKCEMKILVTKAESEKVSREVGFFVFCLFCFLMGILGYKKKKKKIK